jgi:hypothetical protein
MRKLHYWRKPNRPTPMARIPRRQPDVYDHDDGTVSIAYLSPAEARLVYECCCQSRKLFGLTFALGQMLGIDEDYQA